MFQVLDREMIWYSYLSDCEILGYNGIVDQDFKYRQWDG